MRKSSSIFRRVFTVPVISFLCLCALVAFLFFRQAATGFAQNEISPSAIRLSENFDGVTAPALPLGWTTSITGQNAPFATSATNADSPPNAVFTNNPASAGSAEISTPIIAFGSGVHRLSFRHWMQSEATAGFDGGVLEISVAGGAFQDILTAGGVFNAGGYLAVINADATGNPLIGRQSWTGIQSYMTTQVTLPSNLAFQNVRFRWRYGTDAIESGVGWRIDNIQLTEESTGAVIGFSENFDSLTVPQLPQNWTTTATGVGSVPFTTSTATPDSPPNCVFTNNPGTVTTSEILSPVIRIGGNEPKLIFRHLYNTEAGFDGGVLEIKIGNGAFQDILTAGGTFVTGGYNRTLSTCCGNPLPGRQAWSGLSAGGYITTEVNLPPTAYRQQVQFKWKRGSDDTIPGTGWRIDNVQVTNAVTGENSSAIAFSSVGTASPYPSEIQVADLTGTVTRVSVNVQNFTHTAPDDVDLKLVSPSGRSVVLMSDVGGNNGVTNLNLSFEDIAPTSLPDSAALTSGNYKPTDFEAGDAFPAPAPQTAPTGTKLSAFFNDQPNGSWKLFAVDDTGENVGNISGGWSIVIDTSTTAIGIPAVGTSEPYPSEINVLGQSGLVSKVTVGLENFSHSAPDDVDLILVAPNGRKVVLMSDVGGATEVNNISFTFDDAATGSLPDSAALASGTFKPTDFEPDDVFPAPAPAGAPTGRMLSVLNGSEPNGAWKLFLVDDNGNNTGTINAWTLNLQTSESVIAIPASGTAQPYPSEVAITGQSGSVTKVTVTLNNFSHTSPDDVDVLLVAPNGRRIVLMSDVGGGAEVGGLSLTFDDTAAALPDGSPLVPGTFKPTDFEPGEAFPAPAPAGVTGTTLNAFYGTAANGVWKLYVADDTGEHPGSIAGSWSLQIQSSISACLFNLSSSVQAFPITGGSGGFNVLMPAGCPWTASTASGFINISAGTSGEGDGSISFTVAPNLGPARTGSIVVTNGAFSRTFQIQQASGCPFAVNQTNVNFSAAGGSGSVQVSAGAECGWQASASVTWIFITSAQQSGDGTVTFVVQPNPAAAARSGTITIGARVVTINQAGARGRRFDFDGDGRADISVYRAGNWYLQQSTNGFAATQFGINTDKIVPADFDGDRKTDIAVFRDGNWYLLHSSNSVFLPVQFGLAADQPVPADYNGDGRDEIAVYRGGEWYTLDLTTNQTTGVRFGIATDKPVAADYDGDGRSDPAVYRSGVWYLLRSTEGFTSVSFGIASDKPVVGDYDGDGRSDQAVYRSGNWYVNRSTDGQFVGVQFGLASDIPVAADYDGDGKTDLAVFRGGVWYLLNSTSGFAATQFGLTGDIPVPSAFLP